MDLRELTRERRRRIESGERLDLEEVIAWGVTFEEALTVFDGTARNDGDRIYPECCGETVICLSGLFGSKAECKRCGANIVDALSPLYSPILERGNSWITAPGDKLIEAMGERHWFVMHEGNRALTSRTERTGGMRDWTTLSWTPTRTDWASSSGTTDLTSATRPAVSSRGRSSTSCSGLRTDHRPRNGRR